MAKNDTCDERVFNEIFKTVSHDLFRFLYYKFGDENYPDDLVQEAFVKLWNNCLKVTPEKARSFLYTVASNLALNVIAKKKTERKHRSTLAFEPESESPHDHIVHDEFKELLNRALEDLPEKQRVAFMLNRAEGKKHKEIAEMLGISKKAVEKRIYKAADFLLDRLGRKI